MKHRQQRYRSADDRGGATSQFCPNCGQPVKVDAAFCGNCGFNLKAFHDQNTGTNAPDSQAATSQTVTPTNAANTDDSTATNETPVQPLGTEPVRRQANNGHPTPKWVWITAVVVIVVLAGGYLFGKNYYSRTAQLDRAVTAIKGDNKGVAKYFSSSDPNLKLSDSKLKPLSKHFKAKPGALATFKRQLNNGQTNDGRFTFQLSGKHWLFFDKYTIHVKPVYPTVTTNRDGAKITVDGKQVAKSTSTSYSKQIGPLVPGNYKIAATGTVSGQKMTNSGTYYINEAGESVDLALRTVSFSVQTAPKTVVYVNDKKVGTADNGGQLDVTDFPWSGNLEVTGKYTSGKSTVTSKSYKVTEDGESVPLEFAGVMSLDDASSYMDNLWNAVSNVTSTGDESDASDYDGQDLSDYYTDGSANAQYKEMIRMATGYYNDDDIYSVDYDCEVRSVVPTGKNKFIVTYYLTYDFSLEDSEHIQEFSYNAHMEKTGNDDYKIIKVTGGDKIKDTHEDD